MIIIDSSKPYIHTDEHGNVFELKYITGRNQQEYNEIISKYSAGLAELEKMSKEGEDKISQSDIDIMTVKLFECNVSLCKLLIVSVNSKTYTDINEEFIKDLPVRSQEALFAIVYSVLPILSGAEKPELKN